MRRTRLRLLSACALTSCVLSAAACSDDTTATDTSSPTTDSTTTTSTSSTTTTSTAPPSTEPAPTQEVSVFFSSGTGDACDTVDRYEREIAAGAEPIRAALDELVGGPTGSETSLGASSFFSAETAGTVRSTTVDDGLLIVDFADFRATIPNASTSCGSAALLAQLDATAFQFPEVQRVRYQLEGSCDLFFNWLQSDCTDHVRGDPTPPGDVPTVERASGSGCTPGPGELPDGRWFGLIGTADTGELTFDLACWFTGDAATDAAAEDGEESPPPNDYYIRNDNDLLRDVEVAPDAEVTWLPSPGDPSSAATIDYATWAEDRPLRSYQPEVWLTVEGGAVVAIEEQYRP